MLKRPLNQEYVYGLFNESNALIEVWGSRVAAINRCHQLQVIKPPPNWVKAVGSDGKVGELLWKKLELKRQKEESWYDDW